MTKPVIDFDVLVNRNWCKGCGICTTLCPKHVLQLDKSGKVMVNDTASCSGCGKCETHCPDFAISVERRTEKERPAVPAGSVPYPGHAEGHLAGARV